jgi:hypothetical protein
LLLNEDALESKVAGAVVCQETASSPTISTGDLSLAPVEGALLNVAGRFDVAFSLTDADGGSVKR